MKKKLIVISTILLVTLLISGASMAWFSSSPAAITNKFKAGTVEVEVVEQGFVDIEGVTEGETYTKNVEVKSKGTKNTYVRVRLVPYWDDPSLPISNVVLNFYTNGDWVKENGEFVAANEDGYYGYFYFKNYLESDQTTSPLLKSVEFTELGPEYKDAKLTIKVVAEGVQITNDAWKYVWGLNELPFYANQPWNPTP